MKRSLWLLTVICLGASSTRAFDTDTHGWITHQGYLKSNLSTFPLRERQWGLAVLREERVEQMVPTEVFVQMAAAR